MSNSRRQRITSTSLGRSNITACFRCRQKKKRCDSKLPTCSLCEAAGAECVGYDATSRRNVPRSYILSLEERVAYLEKVLHDNGIQDCDSQNFERLSATTGPSDESQNSELWPFGLGPASLPTQAANSIPETSAMTMAHSVASMSQNRPENEPAMSKLLLEELMNLRTNPQIARFRYFTEAAESEHISSSVMNDLERTPVSLPPKEAAQNLVSAYFQFAKSGMPLLHEITFKQKLELVYSNPGLIDSADANLSIEHLVSIFMVFEVFAVALTIMQKQEPSRIPISIADRYHKMALRALSKAGIPNDVEGVQALLLIGQYSYHHPTIWAVWKTIGAALRLAVELGLHHDPSSNDLNFLTADTMRRSFWVAYSMDRNISIALGIPSCLSDGAITTKFPSEVDDEYITPEGIAAPAQSSFWGKCINHHLLRFRQIQSEMQTILFEKPPPPYPSIDLSQWQKDMHDRIQSWYDNVPHANDVTSNERMTLENYELTFQRALLYLYHPSTSIPTPSEPALMILAKCTPEIIRLYRRFFDERRLSVYWQAVENLSSAGIALMYSYTRSSQVRGTMSVRSLETLIRTCSSVLWGMVEHFPAFKGRRDAFDIVASKTLADLAGNASISEETGMMSYTDDLAVNEGNQGRLESQNTLVGSLHNEWHLSGEAQRILDSHSAATRSQIPERDASSQSEQLLLSTLTTEPSMDDILMPPSPWDLHEASFDWDSLDYTGDLVLPAWI